MAAIDHLILPVNDVAASVAFFVDVLGFRAEGMDGPFSTVRVSANFVLQLAPWGTDGNVHLAFALSPEEFDATFARIREARLPYGPSFHAVGAGGEPGVENGAHGPAPTLYCLDPNRHLIEIRTYGA